MPLRRAYAVLSSGMTVLRPDDEFQLLVLGTLFKNDAFNKEVGCGMLNDDNIFSGGARPPPQ
ncbi:hypothetical protein [Bartonella rattaustraliani]|uniref:hypothetical protein n=1 Tax=Bartonella rattaustraliani TaxID=481139 RepID=UPI0012EAAAC6|nr:hypothetical protein [Bartonella rattaustraliani]